MDDPQYWRYEKVAFLALTTLKGIGFRTLLKLAQSNQSFYEAIRFPKEFGLDKYFSESSTAAQAKLWSSGVELARELASIGTQLIFKGEEAFPKNFRLISDAPEWIFVQGNTGNLHQMSVAIVGTRKPSDDGILLTRLLVASLAQRGCPTVSGLAAGIDQIVHTESIRYEIPTVAILGTGITQNYPKGSEELRELILQSGGTIITEYLPKQSYSAENFVRRNRLQAALGEMLFPTEWSVKSGTAHTVRFAHKYGKKIVNLHLPMMSEHRPEIKFSQDTYKALAIEIPRDFEALQILFAINLEALDIDISSPPVGAISDEQNFDSFFDDAESAENSSDPQLSLL